MNAEPAHSHDHDHGAGHEHEHRHARGLLAWLRQATPFLHSHGHGGAGADATLESSARGIWALKVSLLGLGATALFQLCVVLISGSVALLADTIHNFSDALTAVPLWIAFVLGRRPPSRRYTYGYGRAEDVAGLLIVAMILASALLAAYESYARFLDPRPIGNVAWVLLAAVAGFVGNEAVARLRIKVGREIGSAALVADGRHARADGFTSLAVLLGALGSMAGFPLADPLAGSLITLAILFIIKDSARAMWQRLMDAVDPAVVRTMEEAAATVVGVTRIQGLRVRWLGHKLHGELRVTVDEDLPTRESHRIAEQVRHALFHAQPHLAVLSVQVDPCGHGGDDPHALTAHHRLPH